jgi:hypothetical protein
MHMLSKKPKNRPTAHEIADMLPCKIAVRPPMQRSPQPRVGRCMGLEGRHWPWGVQLKPESVDSTICAQLDTQVRAHRIWRGARCTPESLGSAFVCSCAAGDADCEAARADQPVRGKARDGVAAVPLCRVRQAARDSATVGSSRAGHGRQCAVPERARAAAGATRCCEPGLSAVSVRSHPPRPSAGPGAGTRRLGGGGIAWYSLRAPQGLRSSPGQCGGHGNAHHVQGCAAAAGTGSSMCEATGN